MYNCQISETESRFHKGYGLLPVYLIHPSSLLLFLLLLLLLPLLLFIYSFFDMVSFLIIGAIELIFFGPFNVIKPRGMLLLPHFRYLSITTDIR